ncbi:FAM91 family protein [Cavenderia fasciculata]|uniref:FAM91 family protein n=1 Tax=Cavenderia fasciculata TaxID=261658 RepID=F4PX98_CACFS|nr:FAM91 family protein [Cavenderia fasciculata]EGG19901.1 FAM91 family protein [Cavenderia fasciculata]|eukprot:XP_004366884.1 FAM91 family protein [Cavenderia fasciculata]
MDTKAEKEIENVKHQLRWKTTLIREYVSDERLYYQEIVRSSISNLVLYPYHIIDKLIGMLNITPFKYYLVMMIETMVNSKSYDELPNFTAVDCLRLLNIGRNQYIDIMNRCRSTGKGFLFKKKKDIIKSLLPSKSLEGKAIDYWWQLNIGHPIPEEEKSCTQEELEVLEELRRGPKQAGVFNRESVLSLISKGLIFVDIPIANSDYLSMPPLEGFVMNRVSGDYFENLLYKIFVTIDERTNIQQLSELLQIDVEPVKQAASLYCRLGFAKKKNVEPLINEEQQNDNLLIKTKWHQSWIDYQQTPNVQSNQNTSSSSSLAAAEPNILDDIEKTRVGLVFDSSITAFLMMGNLGYGLKSHAVTMFEVGKLPNEALDDFIQELNKVNVDEFIDGEAKRYAASAVALKDTIKYLRYNETISATLNGLDLVSCERMNSLEETTRMRVLAKNYSILISMSPFSTDSSPVISSFSPVHFGAPIYEAHSFWFKLYMYSLIGAGPDSILLPKGTRIKRIPPVFRDCEKVRVCSIDHDSINVNLSQLLPTINELLLSSPVLLQAFSYVKHDPLAKPRQANREQQTIREKLSIIDVPFPLEENLDNQKEEIIEEYTTENMHRHPLVLQIVKSLNLQNSIGYISMLRKDIDLNIDILKQQINNQNNNQNNNNTSSIKTTWEPYNVYFGIPIFDLSLNQQVCLKIQKMDLLSDSNVARHNHNSRILSLNLLRFISSTCPTVHPDLENIDAKINMLPSVQNLPLPTQTISFINNVLEI